MLARAALALARHRLAASGNAEAGREAKLITAHLCGVEPAQLPLYLQQPINEAELTALLTRRVAGEPLQYLLGQAGFMGLELAVGPGALIPRPDTEIIVEQAIALLKAAPAPLIADIGVGSGAIALSLAYYLPQATLHGIDISSAALAWARKNAEDLGLAQRCHLHQGDLLEPLQKLSLRFDLIVSNPPYISAAEMAGLPREVRREPALALAGGADGLDFYRRLAATAGPLLKPGGYLLLEHGWQQQERLAALLTASGWRVQGLLHDYGGRPRGLLALGPESFS